MIWLWVAGYVLGGIVTVRVVARSDAGDFMFENKERGAPIAFFMFAMWPLVAVLSLVMTVGNLLWHIATWRKP